MLSALFFVLLIGNSAVLAQTGTATVRGSVVDPQGNVVAGATVTLVNEKKSFTRTQTTSEEGS
jgi:hypothetical protein